MVSLFHASWVQFHNFMWLGQGSDVKQRLPLRRDAESIWRAGVDAVGSERLVRDAVSITGTTLVICGREFPLADWNRVAVVGAGKAGAGMAAAFERAVGEDVLHEKVFGWVNVPADCVRRLEKIHLHAARPAGLNEPTREGVEGSLKILEIVSQLRANDLCVILISGGGSALLPAPVPQITLEDKQAVTRFLMHAGATINELNCVRKQLSRIKGGHLARACGAGQVLVLIISDVIGDPLDVIASGPTVADASTAADARAILQKYDPPATAVPPSVMDTLSLAAEKSEPPEPIPQTLSNHVIGNNAAALGAASHRAKELGYRVHSLGSRNAGEARAVGRELADLSRTVRDSGDPVAAPACVLWGGETVVHLAKSDQPRKGGRNQEVVLAGLEQLWDDGLEHIVLLSGGTDGEDGPTDAAGAVADADVLQAARSRQLLPADYLAINNSYRFFEQTGGLLKTGPTHTNVMDVGVVLVGRT